LDAVLRQDPHNAEALALKGVTALRSGNPVEAIRMFFDAKGRDANLLIVHLNLAASYRELNQLPQAMRTAREAVERYPENPQIRLELARTLWQMDDKAEALETAIEVFDIDNGFLPAYVDVAQWLIAEHQLDPAIVTLQQGLALLPQNNDLRAPLAHAYLEAGRTQEAITEARLVVSMRGWPQDREFLAECSAAADERPSGSRPREVRKLQAKAKQE
jgi:tetratricopeptide (TPR) repeat protein